MCNYCMMPYRLYQESNNCEKELKATIIYDAIFTIIITCQSDAIFTIITCQSDACAHLRKIHVEAQK